MTSTGIFPMVLWDLITSFNTKLKFKMHFISKHFWRFLYIKDLAGIDIIPSDKNLEFLYRENHEQLEKLNANHNYTITSLSSTTNLKELDAQGNCGITDASLQ